MPDPVAHHHYPRPPITEAVLEVRVEGKLSARDMERCVERFRRQYKNVENITEFEINFEDGKPISRPKSTGFKLTSENAVDLLLLNPSSVASIRLAPYSRWEDLLESAKSNFDTFTKLLGRQVVSRIGARFVNRIDVPSKLMVGRSWNDFFRLGANVPGEVARAYGSYYVNLGARSEEGVMIVINTGVIGDNVLLDHTSVLLDIDVALEGDIPQRIDDMWARAEVLRKVKNRIFESSITDRCRELFR